MVLLSLIQRSPLLQVTSPYGNNLHHNENVTHGQFAFTTNEAGNYLACFWLDKHQDHEVSLALDWKNGIAAKDWESVAKKEKIEVIFNNTFISPKVFKIFRTNSCIYVGC